MILKTHSTLKSAVLFRTVGGPPITGGVVENRANANKEQFAIGAIP